MMTENGSCRWPKLRARAPSSSNPRPPSTTTMKTSPGTSSWMTQKDSSLNAPPPTPFLSLNRTPTNQPPPSEKTLLAMTIMKFHPNLPSFRMHSFPSIFSSHESNKNWTHYKWLIFFIFLLSVLFNRSSRFLVATLILYGLYLWWQIKIAGSIEGKERKWKGILEFISRFSREISSLSVILISCETLKSTFCIVFEFRRARTNLKEKCYGFRRLLDWAWL